MQLDDNDRDLGMTNFAPSEILHSTSQAENKNQRVGHQK